MPEEIWTEVCDTVQETGIKAIPKKKKCKKANDSLRRLYKSLRKEEKLRQRRKGKIYPFECWVPRIARRHKKAFLSDQCKEIEENKRMGRLEISLRKLEKPREHFMQRWAQ